MDSDFKSSYLLEMNLEDLKSNTLATLFTDYPDAWTVKRSAVGTRVLAVLCRGLL